MALPLPCCPRELACLASAAASLGHPQTSPDFGGRGLAGAKYGASSAPYTVYFGGIDTFVACSTAECENKQLVELNGL